MPKKKNDKKIIIFQPAFHDILACRDPKKRPNIEIFVSEPENIYQESLGRIAGVFEIIDDSEDSSYVVNYLISVIKKEYFSRPKRGAVESFEAALHKANLALSKLASHGSVSWIGHLNAVCMVIEKNNLHISQTGTACVLLLRSNTLTNISEGGEILESNPLKTFQDVLSGRMENNDKIILTTDSIFEIFSLEEIKKSALKFSKPEFIQFLKTALINEMDRAAVLVADISEKEEEEETPAAKRTANINAFSQAAFQRAAPGQDIEKRQEEKREIIEEIKEEFKKTQDGFVDEKTGHIYIKDRDATYESEYSKLEYISTSKDKLVSAGGSFVSAIGKAFAAISDKIKTKLVSKNRKEAEITAAAEARPEIPSISAKEKIIKKAASFREKISPMISRAGYFLKNLFLLAKDALIYKIAIPVYASIKKLFASLALKYKSRKRQIPVQKETAYPESQSIYQSREDFWKKRTAYLEDQTPSGFSSFAKMLLPSFSKIKNIIANLSLSQKIYAAAILFAIIIVPYFIVKYEKKSEEETVTISEEVPQSVSLPLSEDANLTRIENLESAYQGEGIISVASINGKNFAVGREKIVSLSDQKEYPLSDEFKNADLVSQMDDLNFIFIMKNKKIVSFSATAGKFQDNNISVPDGANIISARSYLTYLYLLDGKNNQIYRYPRAEGGFGEKTNWLKASQDLSGSKDMAINDNIYVTDGKQIFKFFQGKKQEYSMGQTATPIAPDRIYTKPASENLYIFDKENSRVVKLDKDGKITAQYYNSEIGSADSFAVDEEANKVYISKNTQIQSFGMN